MVVAGIDSGAFGMIAAIFGVDFGCDESGGACMRQSQLKHDGADDFAGGVQRVCRPTQKV